MPYAVGGEINGIKKLRWNFNIEWPQKEMNTPLRGYAFPATPRGKSGPFGAACRRGGFQTRPYNGLVEG